MGTSGTMSTSNTHVKYNITINQNSQSIENNCSNVTISVYFWRDNSGYTTYGSGTVWCKINGTTYSASVSPSQKITNSGITLFSKTLDIYHNSDGTKTLDTSAWISLDTPLTSSEQGYSQTLSTIPRASSISSISGNTFGSSVTVYISRASSSFTHTVVYERPDGNQFTIGTGVATSCSFTPALSDSNYVPTSTSGMAKIYVYTYSGSTYIGSKSSSFTIYVPSSVVPVINSVSLAETVSGIASQFESYVQGKSKILVNISASGAYSSTIKSYSVSINGASYTSNSFTTDFLSSSGSNSCAITVTDSRNRTASTTVPFTVVSYSSPVINSFAVSRCNSDGTANDEGNCAKCVISASISSVNNKNTKLFQILYKKLSDTSWNTVTLSSDDYSLDVTQVIQNIDTESEYNFKVVATDFFSSAEYTHNLSTAYTIMDFNQSGKGIAIGKVSTQDAFEINMDMNVTGDISQNSYFNGRRMQYIPNGIGSNYGWYLVATGTITATYDNHAFSLNVTEVFSGANGILYANIRRNATVFTVADFKILSSGRGLLLSNFCLVLDTTSGYRYRLYAKTMGNSQMYLFEVLSESSLDSKLATPIFTFNSPAYTDTVSTPSGTTPTTYGPQVLYSNTSGTSGTITLSETAANFSYIEIYTWGDGFDITKVYNPNGKKAALFTGNVASGVVYMYFAGINISGTSITWSYQNWAWGSSTLTVSSSTNGKIYQVIGYR